MNKLRFGAAARALLFLIALLTFVFSSAAQYTNGIYAEFNTSMGSYTCRLEYVLAPKAVANFIGLATGERAWLSETSGVVRATPLLNGVIFHRVVSNFVNQAGSPTGVGNGGPGYVFPDEFSPTLRHTGFGILSMANSGPDSNGSQFFMTVGTQTSLNDVHTVFGRLYGGSNVVFAINRVATDGSSRPLTNVVLNNVAIRRIGTAAQAFNIHTNGLAVVTNLTLNIAGTGTNVSLSFSNRLNVENRIFASSNLTNWTRLTGILSPETSLPVTNTIYRNGTAAQQFYRMVQVQYAGTLYPPRTPRGRNFSITFTNGTTGTFALALNASGTNGGGTYTRNGTAGNLLGYSYTYDPFNSRFQPISLDAVWDADLVLTFNFDTANSGGVKGTVYEFPFYYPNHPFPYSVSGHFTLTP